MSENSKANVLIDKLKGILRAQKTHSIGKDQLKKLFKEDYGADSESNVNLLANKLGNENNNRKISFKKDKFVLSGQFGFKDKSTLKEYLTNPKNKPFDECSEIGDEYFGIWDDITEFEKEGYLFKYYQKQKGKEKALIFGRNPNDPIEKMGLPTLFEGFKDIKPTSSGKHKSSVPIESEDKRKKKKKRVQKPNNPVNALKKAFQ